MSLKITILYLQQSECGVCVSMPAVYLVLLNLHFLRMSVCLCLYAYCLLSILNLSFLRVCVCVCVCDRERDSFK